MIHHVTPTGLPGGAGSVGTPAPAPASDGAFGGVMDHLLGKVTGQQLRANEAVRDLAAGRTDSVHNVLLEVAKADINFRLVLEIRNRLTDAYQEIMRMQV